MDDLEMQNSNFLMEFNMGNFNLHVLPTPFGEFLIRTLSPVSIGTLDLWHLAYDP